MEKYDKNSVESIFQFAKLLTGKSLSELVTLPHNAEKIGSRGDLGNLVEQFFFDLPVTTSGLDFPNASLELKTTGLLRKSDGRYKAKERLVLTMVNYLDIVNETWETSSFLKKCRLMLILFYLYEKEVPLPDRKFVLDPILYKIENHDLPVIKRDWEAIQKKVLDGKAHEISEGDTFYLGACRKGPGGPDEVPREQPFSPERAKARAFSFKPSYVNLLIAGADQNSSLNLHADSTIESATIERFKPFFGMSVDEISNKLSYSKSGPNHKGFLRDLSMRILRNGIGPIPELEKAGIEMKTIRLTRSGRIKESMSFPAFKFDEILSQTWEESTFFDKLESKFLFVVFRENEKGALFLQSIKYWNMPYEDRLEAKRVWEETKRRVALDARHLPKISESNVAHVRPKAKNASDTLRSPQGFAVVKQCFWLNATYVRDVILRGNLPI